MKNMKNMKNMKKIILLAVSMVFTSLLSAFTNTVEVSPRKVVIRGGQKCGNTNCYNVVKQKGSGSDMILKCLGAGINLCVITKIGIDEDNQPFNHTELSDYDYVQYNFGLNYAQSKIIDDVLENGTYTWTLYDGVDYHIYKTSWVKLTNDPIADYEITIVTII